MASKIWKICVVGLMAVSPVMCAAQTPPTTDDITTALSPSGAYIVMAYEEGKDTPSIELIFEDQGGNPQSFPSEAGLLLSFAKTPNLDISLQFCLDDNPPEQLTPFSAGEGVLSLTAGGSCPWNKVRITGAPSCGDFIAYLDGVQVYRNGSVDESYVAVCTNVVYPERITLVSPMRVAIDIKPGVSPNPINQGSNGLIPVAIFTTDEFDASTVDAGTVALNGAKVAVRGKSDRLMARMEDVNGDGRLDLLVQVETQSEGVAWVSGLVTLTGKALVAGELKDIEGTDSVVIVPAQ